MAKKPLPPSLLVNSEGSSYLLPSYQESLGMASSINRRAVAMKVDRKSLANWLCGKHRPPLDRRPSLIAMLDRQIAALIDRKRYIESLPATERINAVPVIRHRQEHDTGKGSLSAKL